MGPVFLRTQAEKNGTRLFAPILVMLKLRSHLFYSDALSFLKTAEVLPLPPPPIVSPNCAFPLLHCFLTWGCFRGGTYQDTIPEPLSQNYVNLNI